MKHFSSLILFLLLSPFCVGNEWFVAPNGNDNNLGTKERPFATIERAIIAEREVTATTKPIPTHTIHIAAGLYELKEPLILGERDSGISFIGEGTNTIISGGRSLDGWKKESDEIWYVDLPKEDGRDLYFEQLFVNGRRATRARTPNNGFFRPQDVQQDVPINSQRPPGTTNQAIMPQKGDLDFLKTTPQEELRFGQFVVHHNWDTTRRIILGYDTENDLLLMKGEPMKHWNPWRTSSLYYIENIRSAFDQPGEWFYDGVNHKALYRPLPGERLEEIQFIVPRCGLNQLVIIKGKPEQRAENIVFKNIKFAYTDSPRRERLMRDAQLDPAVTGDLKFPGPAQINPEQADFWADAVIDIENANSVHIFDCEITNIGEYAIWIKNSDACRIERCALTELGAGGVRIGGVGSSKFNVVDNNIIHRGGRLHASAVGVWLGQNTEDNKVTHNDIGDFYYTGISAGWVWGYNGGVAFRNIMEFNRIHDLGQGALADMGGIYTLGNSEGSRFSNNVIFNVKSYSYGGWGLYPDEGTEGFLMENNLVYNTTDGSFHQHYGKNNTIRNNILAFSTPHQVAVTRVEDHRSMTFEKNIIYWTEGKAMGYQADAVQAEYRNNLWWRVDAEGKPLPVDFNGKTLAEWLARGRDVGSVIADPKFVDPKKRDFRLQPDSPALAMGFVPFDFSKAGVYGEPKWIQRAKDFVPPVHPNVPPEPKPLPLKVSDGFEEPRAERIVKGVASDEGKNLIRVTKENPSTGEQCLEIAYTPGLQHPWDPHLYYVPNYEQGLVQIAFAMKMQGNADVALELRDKSNPYKVGVRLRMSKGKVSTDGKELCEIPINEWVRYEIRTHIGDASNQTWRLRMMLPDGTERIFNGLPLVHNDWRSLDWFGFSNQAGATDQTTYWLDDMEISNDAEAPLEPAPEQMEFEIRPR
ncbi:MAG: right-handed parallel beta-helix repeat-containing protein [Planctomycetaceae bacterium]|jgi:hypothetical protein|nr:right-handed parallel beta-helix repeat-containing protein [Planctomycetaceae bacterium]